MSDLVDGRQQADQRSAPIAVGSRSWLVDSRTGDWFGRFRVLLWLADALVISAAVTSTFWVLFNAGDELAGVPGLHYAWFALILIAIWLLGLESAGSRARWVVGSGLAEYRVVLTASL